jgi:hypothetical protein
MDLLMGFYLLRRQDRALVGGVDSLEKLFRFIGLHAEMVLIMDWLILNADFFNLWRLWVLLSLFVFLPLFIIFYRA